MSGPIGENSNPLLARVPIDPEARADSVALVA